MLCTSSIWVVFVECLWILPFLSVYCIVYVMYTTISKQHHGAYSNSLTPLSPIFDISCNQATSFWYHL